MEVESQREGYRQRIKSARVKGNQSNLNVADTIQVNYIRFKTKGNETETEREREYCVCYVFNQ